MYLKKLALHNFRCFEDVEINFHKNLTLIVGANGAGKTSIMEGAAIAMSSLFVKMDGLSGRTIDKSQAHLKAFSTGSVKDVQAQYPVAINASVQDENNDLSFVRTLNSSSGNTTFGNAKSIIDIGIQFQDRLRKGDTELILPIIAYYGTGRLWDYHKEKQYDVFEVNNRLNGYLDCVDGTANIKLMTNWFAKMTIQKYQNQELGLGKIPELEAVYSAMETCYSRISGYDNVKIQYNIGTKELEVAYQDEGENWMRMSINQLSDGYKSTISLVADIAYRMAVLNPQLLGDVCLKTDGVVIIDEVDLHLHPAWQQRVLEDLMTIFPKVQFIVSTHAPAVISSAKSDNLRILSNYQIQEIEHEIYGDDVNSILNLVMRVPERDPKVDKLFKEFDNLLANKEYEAAGVILDQIDKERQYHDKTVAGYRVKLKIEKMRGGAL